LEGKIFMRHLIALFLLTICTFGNAQTNVRGWYAEGQVWILWDLDNSPPETYAIYSSASPFTNTNQAQLTGRLFEAEWTPFALRTQILATANYIIPNNSGGRFTLPANTGLFVETVHENGAKYYAVVKCGNTAVTANNLSSRIEYRFNVNEPVQAQSQGTATLASGHKSTAYYMWADGRDNHWEGRPDFPIMANRHKNGMPSFFILSEALNMPAVNRSLVVWLHGGGGIAYQSLPAFRARINIEPQNGFLSAMNDDFIRLVQDSLVTEGSVSWHFGWTKKHDPFQVGYVVADDDTIVNYTQRRYLWIVDWVIKNKNVDPSRVAVQGHSMGAAGTTALAKAFPLIVLQPRPSSITVSRDSMSCLVGGPYSAAQRRTCPPRSKPPAAELSPFLIVSI
jgi:pimeloyl-ACP methyl ester carboxylesterase